MTDRALETFERFFGPEFGHGKAIDLSALRTALSALGDPHSNLSPVIHVAGTNGKGSTIAFMRSIAEAAGLRVHAFTKPHLFALRERFVVAGAEADDDALMAAAERIHAVARNLTQFDAQVAAAFLLFSETPADLVLLETGMGGEFDSTNVIENPAVTVITPIGIDHQDALGATLAEIATHKAGVIRRITTTVVARQTPEVMDILRARETTIEGDLRIQGFDWDAFESNGGLAVQTTSRLMQIDLPALYGGHQIDNAGLACVTLWNLRDDWPADAFARGVRSARWPGRLQPLTRGAFSAPIRASRGEVWVDGGHNADGAAALARSLRKMDDKHPAHTVAIIGMRARKDADAFIGALAGAVDEIIAVPLSEAHIAPSMLVAIADVMGIAARAAPSLAAAMQNAAQVPAPRVLICGSFLLAAEALAAERG